MNNGNNQFHATGQSSGKRTHTSTINEFHDNELALNIGAFYVQTTNLFCQLAACCIDRQYGGVCITGYVFIAGGFKSDIVARRVTA